MDRLMIHVNLKIVAPPDRVTAILNALRLQTGPTQVQPGCIRCDLSQDARDPNIIFYREEWSCWTDLEKHIRSDRFSRILDLMEISDRPPDLTFQDVSEIRGMEYVRKLRKCNE